MGMVRWWPFRWLVEVLSRGHETLERLVHLDNRRYDLGVCVDVACDCLYARAD